MKIVDYRKKSIAIIKSWPSEKPKLDKDDRVYLRKIFSLPHYRKESGLKRVGIHIRHGDYETWREGKFFFNFTVMERKSHELACKLFPDSKVEFVITSNINASELAARMPNPVYHPENSPIHDLGLLASCDVIIGPPSTFSMWASFYGNVPIFFLLDADQEIPSKVPPFIVAQNKFSDGSELFLHAVG